MIAHKKGMIYRVSCPDGSWYSEPYGLCSYAITRRDQINKQVLGHAHEGDDVVQFSRDRGKTWEILA